MHKERGKLDESKKCVFRNIYEARRKAISTQVKESEYVSTSGIMKNTYITEKNVMRSELKRVKMIVKDCRLSSTCIPHAFSVNLYNREERYEK